MWCPCVIHARVAQKKKLPQAVGVARVPLLASVLDTRAWASRLTAPFRLSVVVTNMFTRGA